MWLVVFQVKCACTRFGEFVKVVGNLPAIGNWKPEHGISLTTSAETFPLWTSAAVLISPPPPQTASQCMTTTTKMPSSRRLSLLSSNSSTSSASTRDDGVGSRPCWEESRSLAATLAQGRLSNTTLSTPRLIKPRDPLSSEQTNLFSPAESCDFTEGGFGGEFDDVVAFEETNPFVFEYKYVICRSEQQQQQQHHTDYCPCSNCQSCGVFPGPSTASSLGLKSETAFDASLSGLATARCVSVVRWERFEGNRRLELMLPDCLAPRFRRNWQQRKVRDASTRVSILNNSNNTSSPSSRRVSSSSCRRSKIEDMTMTMPCCSERRNLKSAGKASLSSSSAVARRDTTLDDSAGASRRYVFTGSRSDGTSTTTTTTKSRTRKPASSSKRKQQAVKSSSSSSARPPLNGDDECWKSRPSGSRSVFGRLPAAESNRGSREDDNDDDYVSSAIRGCGSDDYWNKEGGGTTARALLEMTSSATTTNASSSQRFRCLVVTQREGFGEWPVNGVALWEQPGFDNSSDFDLWFARAYKREWPLAHRNSRGQKGYVVNQQEQQERLVKTGFSETKNQQQHAPWICEVVGRAVFGGDDVEDVLEDGDDEHDGESEDETDEKHEKICMVAKPVGSCLN